MVRMCMSHHWWRSVLLAVLVALTPIVGSTPVDITSPLDSNSPGAVLDVLILDIEANGFEFLVDLDLGQAMLELYLDIVILL